MIALYSGPRKIMQWGKFLVMPVSKAGVIDGVAFNGDGTSIVTHTHAYYPSLIIVFRSIDGNIVTST